MLPMFDNAKYIKNQTRDAPQIETIEIPDYIQTISNVLGKNIDCELIADDFKRSDGIVKMTYNKNIYEEIKDYFITEISVNFDVSIYSDIGIFARNLIPDIIRIRRKVGYFKLKLVDAGVSKVEPDLINFKFVSVNDDGIDIGLVSFERRDGDEVKIIINP